MNVCFNLCYLILWVISYSRLAVIVIVRVRMLTFLYTETKRNETKCFCLNLSFNVTELCAIIELAEQDSTKQCAHIVHITHGSLGAN